MIKETIEVKNNFIYRNVSAGKLKGYIKLDISELKNPDLSDVESLWRHAYFNSVKLDIPSPSNFNIVDLFCSAGGLSLGAFEAALSLGFSPRTVFCSDMDAAALEVYKNNFSPYMFANTNVASLVDFHIYGKSESATLAYLPEILDLNLRKLINKVDLLIAGPPCQGHSSLNNHTRQDDPRNQLYLSTTAIAIGLNAKLIVIENVARILDDKNDVVLSAKSILEKSGYFISTCVIDASELGGAQTRRRHFLVASKNPHIELNEVAKSLKKKVATLRDVIGDLEDKPYDNFMHQIPNTSEINKQRIKYLFDNDLYNLPDKERPDCHKDGNSYASVYGRLYWDKPAPTITTGFMSPGRGRYIHPSKMRVLTPREGARIQGFPDWFNFSLDNKSPPITYLTKWIGDAVPSSLGYTAVLSALTGI